MGRGHKKGHAAKHGVPRWAKKKRAQLERKKQHAEGEIVRIQDEMHFLYRLKYILGDSAPDTNLPAPILEPRLHGLWLVREMLGTFLLYRGGEIRNADDSDMDDIRKDDIWLFCNGSQGLDEPRHDLQVHAKAITPLTNERITELAEFLFGTAVYAEIHVSSDRKHVDMFSILRTDLVPPQYRCIREESVIEMEERIGGDLHRVATFKNFAKYPTIEVDLVFLQEIGKAFEGVKDPVTPPYEFGTIVVDGASFIYGYDAYCGAQNSMFFMATYEDQQDAGLPDEVVFDLVLAFFRALAQPTKIIVLEEREHKPKKAKKSVRRRMEKEPGVRPGKRLYAKLWIDGKSYEPLRVFGHPGDGDECETGSGKRSAHMVRGHFWQCPYGPGRSMRELRWKHAHMRGVGRIAEKHVHAVKVDVPENAIVVERKVMETQ